MDEGDRRQGIKIELVLSGFSRSPLSVNGRRLKFCPECGGYMAVDRNGFDLFCPVCGLIDEVPISEDVVFYRERPEVKKKKQTEYEKRIELLERRFNPKKKSGTPHEPTNRKQLEETTIDRRVEDIIRSLEGEARITDLDLVHGKLPKILSIYNSKYPQITYDQLRNSYNRFKKRQNNKIDKFIKTILKTVFGPNQAEEKIRIARMREDYRQIALTAKWFPACFVYEGTTQIKRECDFGKMKPLHDKEVTYCRKKQVCELIRSPKAPVLVTRRYRSNGKIKRVFFTLMYNQIYMSGDEINNKFENFFLSEALRKGYLGQIPKCPGTRKECTRCKAATVGMFRYRFSKISGFVKDPFYDCEPYMPAPQKEAKNEKCG